MSRIRSKIAYYDLTGGLNNVSTPDTLNSTTKKTESPDMVNVEFLKLGGIKSMDGNIQVGDKMSSAIVGGWEYVKNNSKYMVIALRNGEVRMLDAVTNTFKKLFQFPHSADRVSFCNMNNGFVATNGSDDPIFYELGRHQIVSGTVSITTGTKTVTGVSSKFTTEIKPGDTVQFSTSDVVYTIDTVTDDTHLTITTNSANTYTNVNMYLSEVSACNATLVNEEDPDVHTPIRGTAIQFYNGRLWIGGENGLFYSQVGQYNKWDIKYDAGVIYSVYNDTSKIKGLGLYSDFMLVHKEYNTYILTCTGDASTIQIKPYSNVSCDSQQSWIVSNTKYYVYSRENMDIFPLSQRTIFSDRYLGDAITNKVRNVFQNLREADLDDVFCVSLPRKRWMIFYMPMIDQVGSSYGLIFDFQCKAFVVRKVPQQVTIAFNYVNEVYIGTEDGKVLKEFIGPTFDGQPIISYYKSPWFDWAGDYFHSFSEFAVDLAAEYKNNFYIRTFKDGDSPYEDRIITDDMLTSGGLIWDGDIHDDNNLTLWDKDVWASGSFNSIRMLLPNNVFETFQVEIGTNAPGQAFAIYGYNFRRIETEEAPW
jgi:hypothetical protein